MYSNSAYWPATVPDSLWQFGLLVPGNRRDFPFVGIEVSTQFVVAFIAGSALICAFAWKRFSEPTYDVNAIAFRDFKDLTIWNLKDSFSLRRAYVIYCVSLVFIYGMLAFFGRLIVQLFDVLQVSGLEVGMGTIGFDSWRWPLFLALGISGFAPLINPLVPAENWLRRFSHEVVGIPTRLREKTVRLKTLIDGAPSDENSRETSNWVKVVLGPKLNSCFALEKNLKSVVLWSYREHVEWSDPEIRGKLNEYERSVRDDTEAALADFQYLTDKTKMPDTLLQEGQDRQKELEKRLLGTVHQLEDLRDKFSLIMAIYCEYGSRFDRMKAGRLKDSIIEKVVDRREMPATGLPLYFFVLVFLAYFLVIKAQWHPLISSVPLSDKTATISAAIETLKVFLLVWLPATTVAAFMSVVYGLNLSESSANRSLAWATISGALAAFAVAAVGMTLTALLYSALPASNVSQMWQALFSSGAWTGVLPYYLLLSPVAIITFCFLNAVRAPDVPPPSSVIVWLAIAAGVLTLIYLGVFVGITVPRQCFVADSSGDRVEVSVWSIASLRGKNLETCFAYYATLDLIVISACVFFSVLGLARRRSSRPRVSAKAIGSAVSVLAIVGASGFMLGVAVPQAQAKDVVVGFRTDIPPFSYLAPADGEAWKRPYLGYLAELCYEIFDNSDYQVVQVPIDGKNRFARMRRPGDDGSSTSEGASKKTSSEVPAKASPEASKIDVLCDAVTLRPDDPDRIEAGVFSPIVFISGVSYLWRSNRRFADVEVGYLANSTAARVAMEACTVDALRLGSPGIPPKCLVRTPYDCSPEPPPGQSQRPLTKSLSEMTSTVPSYILCPMNDHDTLINWFCSNNGKDKVYFGDREIILGKLAAWNAAGRSCSEVRDPFQSFTYEPYALLVSKADMTLFAFVQRRIYELFSHRAGAEALFYKWFPNQTMSEPLAWLFSLNGVLEQDRVLSGEKGFPAIVRRDVPRPR